MFVIEARRNSTEKKYQQNNDLYDDSQLGEKQRVVRALNAQLGWSKYRIRMISVRDQ